MADWLTEGDGQLYEQQLVTTAVTAVSVDPNWNGTLAVAHVKGTWARVWDKLTSPTRAYAGFLMQAFNNAAAGTLAVDLAWGRDYAAAVTALGPVAYWKCDAASGNLVDTVASLAMTPVGSPTYSNVGPVIPDGTAIGLPGVNTSYFTAPNSAATNIANTFSLVAWFKKGGDGAHRTIVSRGSGGYSLRFNNTDFLELNKDAQALLARSTVTIRDTKWHHVAATMAGGPPKIYLDGVDVTQVITVTGVCVATGGETWIGGDPGDLNNGPWLGNINHVAVFDKVLTQAEITGLLPVTFVNNIILQSPAAGQLGVALHIPMEIPAGVSMYARCQASIIANTFEMALSGIAAGMDGPESYRRCTTLGDVVTSAFTQGTSVAGSTAVPSTFTALESTVEPVRAITILMGSQGVSSIAATRFFWDIGVAGASVLDNISQVSTTLSNQMVPQVVGPIPFSIPAASAVSARMQATATFTGDISILAFS